MLAFIEIYQNRFINKYARKRKTKNFEFFSEIKKNLRF